MENMSDCYDSVRGRSNTWHGRPPVIVKSEVDSCENDAMLPVPPENTSPKPFIFGRRNICGRFTYADLITSAIESSPSKQLTLSQIYEWMVKNVEIIRNRDDDKWKNSVRHNLSLQAKFVRIAQGGTGKGFCWTVDPDAEKTKKVPGRKRASTMDNETGPSRKKIAKIMRKTLVSEIPFLANETIQEHCQAPQQSYPVNSFSHCSGNACISYGEIFQTWPAPEYEPAEISPDLTAFPVYQVSPFRHRGSFSGSSSSPRSNENVMMYHRTVYPHQMSPDAGTRTSNWHSPSGCDSLANSLSKELSIGLQVSRWSDNAGAPLPTNVTQGGQIVGYNIVVSQVENQRILAMPKSNSSEDIDRIVLEKVETPLKCDVNEVIKHELNMGSIIDFD